MMKYMISLYHITLLLKNIYIHTVYVICVLDFVMAMSHAAEHCRGQLRDLGLSPEEDGVELRCGNEGCIGWYMMISDVSSSSSFFPSIKKCYRRFLFLFAFKWFSDSTWFNLIQLRKRVGTPRRLFFVAEVASVPTNSVQRYDEPPSTSWTSLATESGPFKRQLMLQWFVSMWKVDETWAKHIETLDISIHIIFNDDNWDLSITVIACTWGCPN